MNPYQGANNQLAPRFALSDWAYVKNPNKSVYVKFALSGIQEFIMTSKNLKTLL